MGRSHQGVLRGYEKTKQRQDNSILKVSIFLSQINKQNHQLKKGRSVGTELDTRLVSSESKDSQDTKGMTHTYKCIHRSYFDFQIEILHGHVVNTKHGQWVHQLRRVL